MSEVQKIEQAVKHLSEPQFAEFRRWFMDFDAEAWDEQMEADAVSGKFDALAEDAISDYRSGSAREL
jgi:hypothetical protein